MMTLLLSLWAIAGLILWLDVAMEIGRLRLRGLFLGLPVCVLLGPLGLLWKYNQVVIWQRKK